MQVALGPYHDCCVLAGYLRNNVVKGVKIENRFNVFLNSSLHMGPSPGGDEDGAGEFIHTINDQLFQGFSAPGAKRWVCQCQYQRLGLELWNHTSSALHMHQHLLQPRLTTPRLTHWCAAAGTLPPSVSTRRTTLCWAAALTRLMCSTQTEPILSHHWIRC